MYSHVCGATQFHYAQNSGRYRDRDRQTQKDRDRNKGMHIKSDRQRHGLREKEKCTATCVVPHNFIMRRTAAGTEIETDRHRKTETETKGCT